MRRSLLLSALIVAGTLLACDEDPIAPPTTGSISLRVILGTQGQQQAPALQTTAATEEAQTAPAVSMPRTGFKVKRSDLDTESAAVVRVEAASPGQVPTTTASSTKPAAAPAAEAAIDAATIYVIGPTNRTVTGQPGDQIIVDGLTPGSYSVVMLGWVGGTSGELDHYGETSVTVVAGENRTATIGFYSFKPVVNDFSTPTTDVWFEITFPAVDGANSYVVELDASPTFDSPGSVAVTTPFTYGVVPDTGTYYVRARAINDTYAPNGGGWSDSKSVRVVDDQDPSGPDQTNAFDLGFGAAANTTLTELNILPVGDEDWYAVEMCLGDALVAETWAERLTPPSGLDTYLELYDATGTVLIAENDDLHADTLDSYLQTVAPASGTYYLRVFGPYQDYDIGQYELNVAVTEGSGHVGGSIYDIL